MQQPDLRNRIYQSLHDLATDQGINASGKEDVYSCIFGRDSAKSILKILKAVSHPNASSYYETSSLLDICKRGLLTLASLQGTETNIESGEEPGKGIHEYRPDNFERLMTLNEKPWYIYPDGKLRNYDSIDSTPLLLIAFHRYWQQTGDTAFLLSILPHIEAGLNWIITYGDRDKDQLLEYELPKERNYGGLVVQSWTDSKESMLDANGEFPLYPIAPVEVQGYAWLALKLWADVYKDPTFIGGRTEKFAGKLSQQADALKERFNSMFLLKSEGYWYAAQALDGAKSQIPTITGNPMLLLWATYQRDGKQESILDDSVVGDFINRAFLPDMFEPDAGIRTMSSLSPTFEPTQNNYHNGSFWPILNGMAHEGIGMWGHRDQAEKLREATLAPIRHFEGCPIELYVKDPIEKYLLYKNAEGQESCRIQAWSAAAALDLLTE